jgi:patatin-like phospholipase/acyl hydrolase
MAGDGNTIRILSIDGGGIRGVIPALILSALQKMIGQTPLVDLFDVVAGTSTGGLIALGLTVPGTGGKPRYVPDDMVRLYTEDGPRIFSRGLWYRLTSLGGLSGPRYPARGIESVLREKFGAVQMKDALKEVLVTSYDLQNRRDLHFTRRAALKDPNSNYLMRDVARATSAAPTYFPPASIRNQGDGAGTIAVDGGVGANNPSLLCYVLAMKYFPGKDVVLVSLGTGKAVNPFPAERALGWGILGWAVPITDVLFDAQASLVSEEVPMLWSEEPHKIGQRFRFQARLAGMNLRMDDATPGNLAALRGAAEDLINEREDDLRQLADLLLAPR